MSSAEVVCCIYMLTSRTYFHMQTVWTQISNLGPHCLYAEISPWSLIWVHTVCYRDMFKRTSRWHTEKLPGPPSAVGNVSGYRCLSDCRSRGRAFDPGPVPYFHGDWSWNYFYGHSPPFRWFIQEGLLSVRRESMCTNYWLTACSSLPRKKCG